MSLVCSIELSKERGATVTVTDGQGKVTQTIHMDGTTITLKVRTQSAQTTVVQGDASVVSEVEKGSNKSKITQTPTLVRFECQDFEVDADTVRMRSNKDTEVSAKGDVKIQSKGDLTAKSSAKGTLEAARDLTVKAGARLSASGGQKAELSAPQVNVSGDVKTSIDGGSQLQMKALKISAKGRAQLEMAAPITNVGQALTSVKGQLVKVEGALVKLG